jgi:GNAT superfamily N-acetyltransferase
MKCLTTKFEDLNKIVDCHKSAFPNSLSSKMGYSFIHKMMEWYIVSDRGVLFHIVDDNNELMGYCGGIITEKQGLHGAVSSISQYSFNTFLMSYLKKPWLILHNENIKKIPYIIKNILLKFGLYKGNSKTKVKNFYPFMGLVVIALKKEIQGKGIGAILLSEFETRAKNRDGIKKISLSVKLENINAIRAYKKNGWEKVIESKLSVQMVKFL